MLTPLISGAVRWPRRVRPVGGFAQFWAAFPPLVSAVERGVGSVQKCHAAAPPDVLTAARRWAGPRADLPRDLDLDAATATVWPDFAALGGWGPCGRALADARCS